MLTAEIGGAVRRGTNLVAVGGFNQAVVLDRIRRAPAGLSRVEIAAVTGLSAQTISNVSRRLLDTGIVREAGKLNVGPGKPRTLLQLEPTGRFAVGVHLDPTVVTYVVLDLAGGVIADHRTSTPTGAAPAEVIEVMAGEIGELLTRVAVPRDRVLGVGIAAPGPVDSSLGMLLNPPLLDGWTRVPLREALFAATGLPVLMEKDVAAAAVAETWSAQGSDRNNFAFFYYGTGIGMGFVIDREVLRGASDNAGDMGHIRVSAYGPLCSCGRTGCIGELVVPHRLVDAAISAGIVPRPTADASASSADAGTVDRLFTAFAAEARNANAAATGILATAADNIASAVVAITNLLDVDHVIFGGPFWSRIAPLMLERIDSLVNNDPALISHHKIVVANSSIGEDVAAIGAGCLVLDHALSPRPSTLLISS